MKWLALEAFASLSETLSFTRTAVRTGVTQPNVSKLIASLEAELGVSLFIRNRKQVALTPAGVELREAFVQRHSELRDAIERFRTGQKGLHGKIRVGCLPELGINAVFPHVLRFQKEHPGVEVEMLYCAEAEILSKLGSGRLDFGICARGHGSDLLRAYPILSESISILGVPAQIKKLQAGHFKRAPWVEPLPQDSLTSGFLHQHRRKLPFDEIDVRLTVNSHRSMLEALGAGIGFAVLPEESAQRDLREGRLARLPGLGWGAGTGACVQEALAGFKEALIRPLSNDL
jgi:DNA-binding transcriptional LysR family regulator